MKTSKALDFWPIAATLGMPVGALFGFVLAPRWHAPMIPLLYLTWAGASLLIIGGIDAYIQISESRRQHAVRRSP